MKKLQTLELDELANRDTPQFYRASAEFAYRLGGENIKKILEAIPFDENSKHISIDTRVAMLNPGWFPCIPGWHCDDFHRPTGKQPILTEVLEKAPQEHFIIQIGDHALTEFVDNEAIITPYVEMQQKAESESKNLYQLYDAEIERTKTAGSVTITESETLYSFTPLDFHRGVKATKKGWRLFFRATQSNHREPKNEIRTQTQIYMDRASLGW